MSALNLKTWMNLKTQIDECCIFISRKYTFKFINYSLIRFIQAQQLI